MNGGRGVLHKLTENKVSAGVLLALIFFALSWFTSVSDARALVVGHGAQLAGISARIEQLERTEIRRVEELKAITVRLDDILEELKKGRHR